MKRRQHSQAEGPPSVPAYIVTFSDMVTLLLTFFVLLISLSQRQDAGIVGIGRNAFVRSIQNFGLGTFVRKPENADFGHLKLKHRLGATEPNPHLRTIAADENDIRQLFGQLKKSYVAVPSQVLGENPDFSVISVRFNAGQWTLNEESQAYIETYCDELISNCCWENLRLYVLGIACDVEEENERLVVSA